MKYLNLYVNFLKKFVSLKKPLKVVFDCSNGIAGIVINKFKIKKLKIKIINGEPDGNFPAHGPNPLAAGAFKHLSQAVKKYKADLGIIFDADGDRVFFVDNKGRKIPSFLIAYLIFSHSQPPFAAEIFSYMSLRYLNLLEKKNLFSSAVGAFFVRKTMKQYRASVGVEYSGHYFYKEFFGCDDGILTALKTITILSKMPYSLGDFYDFSPKFYTALFNVPLNFNGEKINKKIKAYYRAKALSVSFIDGMAFNFENWFLIVRPSNTEPLLRFFVGARDKNTLNKQVKKIKSFIKALK